MLVASHDAWANLAEFDSVTGALREFARGDVEEAAVQGHYARLSGTTAVLYWVSGSLWLRLGDVVRDVGGETVEVEWAASGGRASLSLAEDGEQVASVHYTPGPYFEDDPTPAVKAEDFDFGLFVRNVLADPARRARIYSA